MASFIGEDEHNGGVYGVVAKDDCVRDLVERIRQRLGLTTLKYQKLTDLVEAIGLPKEKLCTYCWDGAEPCEGCPKNEGD